MLMCTIPPSGWTCNRDPGHEGPCAAMPSSPSEPYRRSSVLSEILSELKKIRGVLELRPI